MPEPVAFTALAALLTRRAAGDIVVLLQATPDDKLVWRPENMGRSLLEQAKECAIVNTIWAVILRERGLPDEMPLEFTTLAAQAIDNRESAVGVLQTTADALVAVIEGVGHEETGVTVKADEISGQMLSLADCCLYPYWHMVYHEGQMNYLQTLYGDQKDRHKYHRDDHREGECEPGEF